MSLIQESPSGVTQDMKNRVIIGSKVVLIPYRDKHVKKYHDWMQDSELLFLTASERLSLQEEYEMQRKWVLDQDKCTFIVCDNNLYHSSESEDSEVSSMIGDTNIYFSDPTDLTVGEIEVMIAEKEYRGRGFAQETLLLMINFAKQVIGVKKLIAKIKDCNETSIRLFSKLNFTPVSHSDIFGEITYELLL